MPGQEEVRGGPPGQEGPDLVHRHNLQLGHFVPQGEGRTGGGKEAILGIQVDKHLQALAGPAARRDLSHRQAHLALLPSVQEGALRQAAEQLQVIPDTERGHGDHPRKTQYRSDRWRGPWRMTLWMSGGQRPKNTSLHSGREDSCFKQAEPMN